MFKKAMLVALVSSAVATPVLADTIRNYNGVGLNAITRATNPALNFKPQLPQIPLDSLKPACPDLAVSMSQRDLGARGIEIRYGVTNVGRTDYRSNPNQQALQLSESGRMVRNHPFANLAPGASANFTLLYQPGPEFRNQFRAYISRDPDIGYDSNKANDDCRSNNDQASLTTLR